MKRLRLKGLIKKAKANTGTWRPLLIIAAVGMVLFAAYDLIVVPRITAWLDSKMHVQHVTQTALEAAYPDKDISVIDETFHGVEGKPGGKQRILGIKIVGKNYITNDEAAEAKRIVCAAVSSNRKDYDAIVLDSVAEKRFLVFFSRQHKTDRISCDTSADTTQHADSTNYGLTPVI